MSRFTLPACAALACAALAAASSRGGRGKPARRDHRGGRRLRRAAHPALAPKSPRGDRKDAGRGRGDRRRRLQALDARDDHQGCARLHAGCVRPAQMGRRHAPLDPRLRPFPQFPPARRPALHGRHPDQHGGRLWRLPGDRSIRLPADRGLQGRERAAIWRECARRRDQLRDAVGPRPAGEPRARGDRRRILRFPPRAGEHVRPSRRGRLVRHRIGAAGRRVPRPFRRRRPSNERQSRLRALGKRRDPVLPQRQHGRSGHSGRGHARERAETSAPRGRRTTC